MVSLKVVRRARTLSYSACCCSIVAAGCAVRNCVLALVASSCGAAVWKQLRFVFMNVL